MEAQARDPFTSLIATPKTPTSPLHVLTDAIASDKLGVGERDPWLSTPISGDACRKN